MVSQTLAAERITVSEDARLGGSDVAMNGSFLRASLFTSVVAIGVSAMAVGLGLLFVLIGVPMRSMGRVVVPNDARELIGS